MNAKKRHKNVTHRIFAFVGRHTSFTFAVGLCANLFAWFAAFYGYIFVSGNARFQGGELRAFAMVMLMACLAATFSSYFHFGVLRRLGIHSKDARYRDINGALDKDPFGHNLSRLDSSQLVELMEKMLRYPSYNTVVICLYASALVILVALFTYFFTLSTWNPLIILIGGGIAVSFSTYFTFIVSDYWSTFARKNIQAALMERGVPFELRHISSYKRNFIYGTAANLLSLTVLVQFVIAGNYAIWEVVLFVIQSVVVIAFIIFMFLNSVFKFLAELNSGVKNLKDGGTGLLLPSYAYKELVTVSRYYNETVAEINRLRKNLEHVIEERTFHLIKAREEAEAANKAKSQFLTNMSHEMRTPLNGVMGMLDLVLNSTPDIPKREYLELARKSGDSLLDIINSILDLSKIESGKFALESESIDVRALLKEIMGQFSGTAAEKGLQMNWKVEVDVPLYFSGDPARLRQVVANLVDNAVKFTKEGAVDVTAGVNHRGQPPGKNKIWIHFQVKDTGIGIPDKMKDIIFSSFTQLDGSMTREYGGTGLGLTICKEIVYMMGGTMGLESREGKGSRFYFTVPFNIATTPPVKKKDKKDDKKDDKKTETKEEKEKQVPGPTLPKEEEVKPATKTGAKQKTVHILVAEDNAINRKLVVALIKKKGWKASWVENGREVLAALKENSEQEDPFSLILMDVQMPLMDGLEATEIIRQSKEYKDFKRIPIIALTAHALKGDKEKCIRSGMDDYIPKPVKYDLFYRLIEKYI